jgi:DNA-directed RNA polymerase specialized sigma24 family protein
MCEQALVAAAKQGQVEALGTLCQPLARKLIHSAQRITRNREDAEDALQDAASQYSYREGRTNYIDNETS